MQIRVLVDVYPHPFKPYFDVQFEEWQRAGHEVSVFSLARIPGASSPVSVTTVKSLREAPAALSARILARCISAPLRSLRVAIAAGSLLEGIKLLALDAQLPLATPDVFFVHNLAAAARFWYLKRIFRRVPVGLYYHGGEIPGVAAISQEQSARALAGIDVVLTNTRSSAQETLGRGARPEQIRILPVGFRLEDYPWQENRPYRPDGFFRIVSVGRVAPEKGFDVAIRALGELRRRGTVEFEYTLIGDGPEMANIRHVVRECGLESLVRFTGALPITEVVKALSDADVLVLSSVPRNTWSENQACVMQEAMLMGAVVVAADTGGVPESIPQEMRQFMFAPGEQQQLADSIERLLQGGAMALRELGRIGRDFVLRNYDVRALNARILATLGEVKDQRV
jgi:colanic acid/amylovoran biosynthesis glycosyltransferase